MVLARAPNQVTTVVTTAVKEAAGTGLLIPVVHESRAIAQTTAGTAIAYTATTPLMATAARNTLRATPPITRNRRSSASSPTITSTQATTATATPAARARQTAAGGAG
jgi:hypothetical protein